MYQQTVKRIHLIVLTCRVRRQGSLILMVHCKYAYLGWLCVAKVPGILRHRGVQLMLASSWARPAILVADRVWGGMFLFLFLHFYYCSSFSPVLIFHLSLLSLFSLSPGDDTKWPIRVDVSLNPNTINQITEYRVLQTGFLIYFRWMDSPIQLFRPVYFQ